MSSSYPKDELDILAQRIVYSSKTFDPETRLPIVIMNSTSFPSSPEKYTPELMSKIISRLPNSSYVLVFFACGAPNKPSWSWISKIYNMLDRQIKKRVGKVYIVHESWWVRAVMEMFRGIVSNKFKSKVVHVSSLSQLAKHIDITLINIPPDVYIHNIKNEPVITIPRHHSPIFGVPLKKEGNRIIYPKMWPDCIQYLKVTAIFTKNIFQKEEDPELVTIVKQCYDRGQLLDLDDYGPHVTASLIKSYLHELPNPLLPIKYIPLPIQDTLEYNRQVFQSLPDITQKFITDLIPLFITIIENHSRTLQTPKTIALSISPSLIGRYASSKESMAIAVRFTRNLIDFWPQISSSLHIDSSDDDDSDDDCFYKPESTTISNRKAFTRHLNGSLQDSIKDRTLKRVNSDLSYSSVGSDGSSSYNKITSALNDELTQLHHFPNADARSLSSSNSSIYSGVEGRNINSNLAIAVAAPVDKKISDSTGRLTSRSDESLVTPTTPIFASMSTPSIPSTKNMANSNNNSSNSSSNSSSARSSLAQPPPPPPPLRKSASTAFRTSFTSGELRERKSMSNLSDKRSCSLPIGPNGKPVTISTKRGKMVAELAKLYEEREEVGVLQEVKNQNIRQST